MLRRLTIAFASLAAVVAACSGPTTLDATRYARACATASDCVAVSTDACCGCPTVAIATSDQTRYESDLAAAAKNCPACVEKPCAAVIAVCQAGLCVTEYAPEAGSPVPDSGADAAGDASGDVTAPDASEAGNAGDAASQDAAGDAQDATAD